MKRELFLVILYVQKKIGSKMLTKLFIFKIKKCFKN